MDYLLDETGLLLKIRQGDTKAFSCLYEQYEQPIYHFVLKYVRSSLLAEDITQEIFIKIWENRKRLDEVRTFKKYLFTIAKNHTLNKLKQSLYSAKTVDQLFTTLPKSTNNTSDDLQLKEYQLFIDKVIASLPSRTCKVFKLCREEGKTYEEAASTLGVSRHAIKNHMVSAMKKLSTVIEKKLDITLALLFCYYTTQQLFYFFATLR